MSSGILAGAEPTRENILSQIGMVREGLRRRFRSNFYDFAKHCLGYDLYPHVHGELCRRLQLAYWGMGEHAISGGIDRHLILMPRGSYKTTVITQAWVTWILCQNDPPDPLHPSRKPAWEPPASFNGKKGYDQRILLGQEVDENVKKFVGAIKENITTSPLFLELFGSMGPNETNKKTLKWASDGFNVSWRQDWKSKDYNVATCSLDSAANSTHAAIIIPDDIFGEKQVQSENGLASTIDFYRRLIPIADNPSLMVFVGTRWHDRDLYGYFLDSEEEAFINDRGEKQRKWCVYQESAERSDEEIKAGKAPLLFPEVLSAEVLQDKRTTMRPGLFSCQYLNKPIDETTALFQSRYFSYYDLPAGPDALRAWLDERVVLTTCDTAESDDKDACDCVVLTCAWDRYGICSTVDLWAKRGPTPSELIDELFRHHEVWQPLQIGIEKDRLERSIMFYAGQKSQLEQIWPPWMPLKPGSRSKPYRIEALEPVARAQRIRFRRGHESIEHEFLRYPRGKTRDRIDTLAYQLDMAYMPSHKQEPPPHEVRDGHRIVYPDELAAAWHRHQRSLRIHRGDTVGPTQGKNWKQL